MEEAFPNEPGIVNQAPPPPQKPFSRKFLDLHLEHAYRRYHWRRVSTMHLLLAALLTALRISALVWVTSLGAGWAAIALEAFGVVNAVEYLLETVLLRFLDGKPLWAAARDRYVTSGAAPARATCAWVLEAVVPIAVHFVVCTMETLPAASQPVCQTFPLGAFPGAVILETVLAGLAVALSDFHLVIDVGAIVAMEAMSLCYVFLPVTRVPAVRRISTLAGFVAVSQICLAVYNNMTWRTHFAMLLHAQEKAAAEAASRQREARMHHELVSARRKVLVAATAQESQSRFSGFLVQRLRNPLRTLEVAISEMDDARGASGASVEAAASRSHLRGAITDLTTLMSDVSLMQRLLSGGYKARRDAITAVALIKSTVAPYGSSVEMLTPPPSTPDGAAISAITVVGDTGIISRLLAVAINRCMQARMSRIGTSGIEIDASSKRMMSGDGRSGRLGTSSQGIAANTFFRLRPVIGPVCMPAGSAHESIVDCVEWLKDCVDASQTALAMGITPQQCTAVEPSSGHVRCESLFSVPEGRDDRLRWWVQAEVVGDSDGMECLPPAAIFLPFDAATTAATEADEEEQEEQEALAGGSPHDASAAPLAQHMDASGASATAQQLLQSTANAVSTIATSTTRQLKHFTELAADWPPLAAAHRFFHSADAQLPSGDWHLQTSSEAGVGDQPQSASAQVSPPVVPVVAGPSLRVESQVQQRKQAAQSLRLPQQQQPQTHLLQHGQEQLLHQQQQQVVTQQLNGFTAAQVDEALLPLPGEPLAQDAQKHRHSDAAAAHQQPRRRTQAALPWETASEIAGQPSDVSTAAVLSFPRPPSSGVTTMTTATTVTTATTMTGRTISSGADSGSSVDAVSNAATTGACHVLHRGRHSHRWTLDSDTGRSKTTTGQRGGWQRGAGGAPTRSRSVGKQLAAQAPLTAAAATAVHRMQSGNETVPAGQSGRVLKKRAPWWRHSMTVRDSLHVVPSFTSLASAGRPQAHLPPVWENEEMQQLVSDAVHPASQRLAHHHPVGNTGATTVSGTSVDSAEAITAPASVSQPAGSVPLPQLQTRTESVISVAGTFHADSAAATHGGVLTAASHRPSGRRARRAPTTPVGILAAEAGAMPPLQPLDQPVVCGREYMQQLQHARMHATAPVAGLPSDAAPASPTAPDEPTRCIQHRNLRLPLARLLATVTGARVGLFPAQVCVDAGMDVLLAAAGAADSSAASSSRSSVGAADIGDQRAAPQTAVFVIQLPGQLLPDAEAEHLRRALGPRQLWPDRPQVSHKLRAHSSDSRDASLTPPAGHISDLSASADQVSQDIVDGTTGDRGALAGESAAGGGVEAPSATLVAAAAPAVASVEASRLGDVLSVTDHGKDRGSMKASRLGNSPPPLGVHPPFTDGALMVPLGQVPTLATE